MSTLLCEPPAKSTPTKADVWQAYRSSFAEFSHTLRRLQSLSSEASPDSDAVLRATFEVELARERYAIQRDALAQRFLR
ncbi:MAG TPA: hypothetical protein VGN17_13350 [Bryobacteraceae bacterium]|jgi:hypothetical protein